MGDRFFLTVHCPTCGLTEEEVYYAPTCGFTHWECPNCVTHVDLEKLSGISYEDASNLDSIQSIVNETLPID